MCRHTDLWRTDADMTIQKIVSNFKLITSTVENVLYGIKN